MRKNPVYHSESYSNATNQEKMQLAQEALSLAQLNNLPYSHQMPPQFFLMPMQQFGTETIYSSGKEGPFQNLDSLMLAFKISRFEDLPMVLGIPPFMFPTPDFIEGFRAEYGGGNVESVIKQLIRGQTWLYISLFVSKPGKSMASALLLRKLFEKASETEQGVVSVMSEDSYNLLTSFVDNFASKRGYEVDIIVDFPLDMMEGRFVMLTVVKD